MWWTGYKYRKRSYVGEILSKRISTHFDVGLDLQIQIAQSIWLRRIIYRMEVTTIFSAWSAVKGNYTRGCSIQGWIM